MKVLAINGSPRENGNTRAMIDTVLGVLEAGGARTEVYQAGGREVRGCTACATCMKTKSPCVIGDWINDVYTKMLDSDAIIIGSPTYFSDLRNCPKIIFTNDYKLI